MGEVGKVYSWRVFLVVLVYNTRLEYWPSRFDEMLVSIYND